MAIAVVKTLLLGLNPMIITHKQIVDVFIPSFSSKRAFSLQMRYSTREFCKTASHKYFHAVRAVSSGLEDIEVSSSQFEDFSVTATNTNQIDELKINMVVSGAKTQAIFDNVFSKMVADAQPIPGFRRLKGGKMPDVPKDILLQVLGPSKVYKQVIKRVINSTIAEYVEKEGFTVSKDLRVEQSFEDLEATFEPGDQFSFDAIVQQLK
uniref:peptidylprolyl isomerase n=1 Tax=Davidia involucrata TaxID=16924 RepID=A0A5B7BV09_DAVIN